MVQVSQSLLLAPLTFQLRLHRFALGEQGGIRDVLASRWGHLTVVSAQFAQLSSQQTTKARFVARQADQICVTAIRRQSGDQRGDIAIR